MQFLYRRKKSIGYFLCQSLNGIVTHGFSTKLPLMGNLKPHEKILHQKQLFCDALKIDIHSLVPLQQIHGNNILILKEPIQHIIPGAYDGAVTNSPHIALSILTADCLPILLYEKKTKIIGGIHAGWRGTSLGILQKALTCIKKDFNGSLKDCLVLLGPSLMPCCFEIREDALKILQRRLSFWQTVIYKVNGRLYFDLKLTNIMQAKEMGVPQKNIHTLDLCTFCNPGWFHSYRRDKPLTEKLISIISLS